MRETGEKGDKHLQKTGFMHDNPPFFDDKKGLNTLKTMSFIVNNTVFVLLAGGKKKDVDKQKTETEQGILEGRERENCSDFGEGDSP